MRLDVRGLDVDLTVALLEHVQKQLTRALARSVARIGVVHVRVTDTNGPRGGSDKRCQLEVAFHGGGTAFVEHVDKDLYAAISRAAARLKRMVRRECDRLHPMDRNPRMSASGLPT